MRRLLLLTPLLALSTALTAACAPTDGGIVGSADPARDQVTAATGSPPVDTVLEGEPRNDLVIEQSLGDGSAPQEFSLRCGSEPSGTHPDPEDACAALEALEDPFVEPSPDLVCTEQYGGPQTARITGLWDGRSVDVELSRTDGCEISRWDSFGAVLPGPVGVTDPSAAPSASPTA